MPDCIQSRFGPAKEEDLGEALKGVCCEPCFTAKEDVCRCRCGGVYHGAGAKEPEESEDKVLSPSEAEPFLAQIEPEEFRCRWCAHTLQGEPVHYYEHSGGWTVAGFDKAQWLYIVCPHCGYQWALWKLGVER